MSGGIVNGARSLTVGPPTMPRRGGRSAIRAALAGAAAGRPLGAIPGIGLAGGPVGEETESGAWLPVSPPPKADSRKVLNRSCNGSSPGVVRPDSPAALVSVVGPRPSERIGLPGTRWEIMPVPFPDGPSADGRRREKAPSLTPPEIWAWEPRARGGEACPLRTPKLTSRFAGKVMFAGERIGLESVVARRGSGLSVPDPCARLSLPLSSEKRPSRIF